MNIYSIALYKLLHTLHKLRCQETRQTNCLSTVHPVRLHIALLGKQSPALFLHLNVQSWSQLFCQFAEWVRIRHKMQQWH